IVRGHRRLALAKEHAQAEVVALGALELLGLAKAARMRDRGALEQDRVRRVGAEPFRLGDQRGQDIESIVASGGHRGLRRERRAGLLARLPRSRKAAPRPRSLGCRDTEKSFPLASRCRAQGVWSRQSGYADCTGGTNEKAAQRSVTWC